nr:hypothetical protein BaRGS_019744 [Batillaria attramentaria]
MAKGRQGVLKLTFDKSQRKRAEIVLWFEAARDFTFHIGDSSSNNGYAGDGATQSNDAELHNRGGRLLLYGKDKARAVTYGKLLDRDDFLNGAYKLTINVSNELVTVNNGRETIYYNSFKIFALDGQSDFEGPVNYDLYFGMNRVAAGSYRSGTGLCHVRGSFPKLYMLSFLTATNNNSNNNDDDNSNDDNDNDSYEDNNNKNNNSNNNNASIELLAKRVHCHDASYFCFI